MITKLFEIIQNIFEGLGVLLMKVMDSVYERLEPYALEIFVLGILVFLAMLIFGGW